VAKEHNQSFQHREHQRRNDRDTHHQSGSVNVWRGSVLTTADGTLMENSNRLSLFVTMTCLNGYFQDAMSDSLGESLLKAEKGGAVAVWASSAMCLPEQQAIMNRELYRLLFSSSNRGSTMAELMLQAKRAVSDADIRRSWILLGDPTMRLK
jgi:Peptidase family C25